MWGVSDSYQQYPYQVRYYLNQFYGRPIPTQNHVAFNMVTLGQVFTNVFTTLSYVNGMGQGAFIPSATAQQAYSSALTQHGVA